MHRPFDRLQLVTVPILAIGNLPAEQARPEPLPPSRDRISPLSTAKTVPPVDNAHPFDPPGAHIVDRKEPVPGAVAVIFPSDRTVDDAAGYCRAAAAMELAPAQYGGYSGIESTRSTDGIGIFVSRWRDEAATLAWRRDQEHSRIMEQEPSSMTGITWWSRQSNVRSAGAPRSMKRTADVSSGGQTMIKDNKEIRAGRSTAATCGLRQPWSMASTPFDAALAPTAACAARSPRWVASAC